MIWFTEEAMYLSDQASYVILFADHFANSWGYYIIYFSVW